MKFREIVIFTIVLLITACNGGNSCEDLSSYPTEFDITDVSIQVLVAPELEANPTLMVSEKYNENTEVNYNEIVFSINSETQIIAKKSEKSKNFSFSLLSSFVLTSATKYK